MAFRIVIAIFIVLLVSHTPPWSYREKKRIPTWGNNPLVHAYIFGNKTKLKKDIKNIHKDLNLQHLMTPSGLHLGSLLFLLGLFTKRRSWRFLFITFLGYLVFPYDGLDSFKRMILFGMFRTNPLWRPNLFLCFILTFSFAFIGGQYIENPLSFSLSFIFLATLLTGKNKIKTFLCLFFIQALLSEWFSREFYPVGTLFGLILSLVSPFVFPLLLLEAFWEALPFSEIWVYLLKALYKIKGYGFHLPFFILLPCLLMSYQKRLIGFSLITSFLFYHGTLTPRPKTVAFISPPPKGAKKIKRLKNGYKLEYENEMRCYSRLKGDEWSTHCYQ